MGMFRFLIKMLHVSFLSENETFFVSFLNLDIYICNTVSSGFYMLNLIYM